MSITIADVELAIKVINQWIRQSKRAEQTVRRLMVVEERGNRMPTSMQGFMDMAYKNIQDRQGKGTPQVESTEVAEEPALSQEELEELRKIRDRMKQRNT